MSTGKEAAGEDPHNPIEMGTEGMEKLQRVVCLAELRNMKIILEERKASENLVGYLLPGWSALQVPKECLLDLVAGLKKLVGLAEV